MSDKLYKNTNFWDPQIYIERGRPQFDVALNVLQRYTFKGNETVLDIGCGPGNITSAIAQKVPNGTVLGIDLSANMINYANHAYQSVSNLSFEKLDVNNLSFDHQFDLITSFNTLQWISKPHIALPKILNALTDEGFLLASMMRPGSTIDSATSAILATMDEPQWQHYFANFSVPDFLFNVKVHEYKELLSAVAFKLLFFDEAQYSFPFSSKEELADWFEIWMAHRHAIPEDKRKAFFLSIVEKYLVNNKQRPDECSYNMYTWNFMAKKK